MTKQYKMKAELFDKWIAQLRDPTSTKTVQRYFRNVSGQSNEFYLGWCRAHKAGVCGCALGHFAAANPEISFDADGDVDFSPEDIDPALEEAIMTVNDRTCKSLAEIADWLEAYVERV